MKTSLLALAAVCAAACSYPDPGTDPVGDDDDVPPPSLEPALHSISPSVAAAGDTVILEGSFDTTATVDFPGAPGIPATVEGPHRATVVVPAAATAGELTVTTGGVIVGPMAFRRTSFQLGVQQFQRFDDQTNGARQMSALATPLRYMASATIGKFHYVFGGIGAGGSSSEIERAPILADGSLGQFTILPAKLVVGRFYSQAVVLGGFVYLIGGLTDGDVAIPVAQSIERAAILADGSLGAFALVPGVALLQPRHVHQLAVVGDTLYVAGGASGTTILDTIERAAIEPDGSLGAFEAVPRTLATPRAAAHSVVTRSHWYLVGGQTGTATAVDTIERAPIAADGALGAFETMATKLATARNSAAGTVLGDALYVVGGMSAGNTPLASVERAPIAADGALGAFNGTAGVSLPTAVGASSIAVTGNFVHVLGGWNGSSNVSGVVRASINASGQLDGGVVANPQFTLPSISLYAGNIIGAAYYVAGGSKSAGDGQRLHRVDLAPDGSLGAFTNGGTLLAEGLMRHTSAVIGDFMYVFGGASLTNDATNDIERAPIGPDGTPGAFEKLPGKLAAGRCSHATVVAGKFVYAIGGFYGGNTTTVERATINTDGTLGAFSLAGVGLTRQRTDFATAVIGDFLYVFAGQDAGEANPTTSVERIRLNPDGSLNGTFAATTSLVNPRFYPQISVVGGFVYAVGGDSGGTVERAAIQPDGSLGAFAVVPGLSGAGASGQGIVIGNSFVSCTNVGCSQMSLR